MIQTGITLSSTVKFLQKYLSILIVVPAFLGGLWQLIELSSISLTYIRFFSLSQIVPDGLLILLFLLLGLFTSMIGYFANTFLFIKEHKEPEVLSAEEYEKYRKLHLKIWLLTFVIMYALALYYYFKFMFAIYKFNDIRADVGITFIFIVFLNRSLNKCYNFAKEKHREFFKFCNSLLFILYIIVGIYFCKRVHYSFVSTNDFQNIEQIKQDVKNKFPDKKQETLYFNDKFIFIKLIDVPKKGKKGQNLKQKDKIYFMKLDELFENAKD